MRWVRKWGEWIRRSGIHWPGSLVLVLGLGMNPSVWADDSGLRDTRLFFPAPDGSGLGQEVRTLNTGETLTQRIAEVVQAVLDGPRGDLMPAFPADLTLRQVFVDRSGTAYVDLTRKASSGQGLGAEAERLGLWSLVHSICLNFDPIHDVKFLVSGEEASTLYGHVDLSWPLAAPKHPSQAEHWNHGHR